MLANKKFQWILEIALIATPVYFDIPKLIALIMYAVAIGIFITWILDKWTPKWSNSNMMPYIVGLFTGFIVITICFVGLIQSNKKFPVWGDVQFSLSGSFLGMGTQNVNGVWGVRIGTFQLEGINNSEKNIDDISGYLRAIKNGAKFPVLMNVDGILVESNETNGIPPNSKFMTGVKLTEQKFGLTEQEFWDQIDDFEFVFQYGDKNIKRTYSHAEIKNLLDKHKEKVSSSGKNKGVTLKK